MSYLLNFIVLVYFNEGLQVIRKTVNESPFFPVYDVEEEVQPVLYSCRRLVT